MCDEEKTIITVKSEDGKDHKVEVIDVFYLNGNCYTLLNFNVENSESENTEEIVVLKLLGDNEEDYQLITIDDDNEIDNVVKFLELSLNPEVA